MEQDARHKLWAIIGGVVVCCGVCVAVGYCEKKKLEKLWKKEMKTAVETEGAKETTTTNETQVALKVPHQTQPPQFY